MKDYKELGMSIEKLREAEGISGNKLASNLGMVRGNLYEIEAGKRIASGDKLRSILKEIGYDFEIRVFKIKFKND